MIRRSRARTQSKMSRGITAVTVCGYKSLSQPIRLEIRPLTILAGANGSGKSSAMQPLLLLKQTLEASYDPGALLLNGPNVRFTSADQLLARTGPKDSAEQFSIRVESEGYRDFELTFSREPGKSLSIKQMEYGMAGETFMAREGLRHEDIVGLLPTELQDFQEYFGSGLGREIRWVIVRDRCFLRLEMQIPRPTLSFLPFPIDQFTEPIQRIIHIPALRGNPERTYPTTAVGSSFPGTFEKYVASIVVYWQSTNDKRLTSLGRALQKLGLTSQVRAEPLDETQVELRVGRMLRGYKGDSGDLVNIADVGFGVSQALPVVLALLAADPGQLVYIEQPEIHLHPRAQSALAEIIASAAKRGVKVVAETHSSLLILGLQALVAEGVLPPQLVKLHWFRRNRDGSTQVDSADFDETGAFGDWPVDFVDVTAKAERRFLDAAERRL